MLSWKRSTSSRIARGTPPSIGSTFMKSLGWYRWFAVLRNTGVVYGGRRRATRRWSGFAVMHAQRAALEAADGGRRSPCVHLRARREARGVGREAVGEDLVHHRVLPPVERARRVRGRGLDDPPRRSVVVRERTTTREGSVGIGGCGGDGRAAPTRRRARESLADAQQPARAARPRREHHDAVCGPPRGVWPTRLKARAFLPGSSQHCSSQQAF